MTTKNSGDAPPTAGTVAGDPSAFPTAVGVGETSPAAAAGANRPPAPASAVHAHGVAPPELLGQVRALHAPGTGSPLAWLLLAVFVAGGAGLAYLATGSPRPTAAPATATPAVPTVSTVTLQVVSMPPGATVLVDGVRQPLAAPSTVRVRRAERLRVRLELEGYAPYEETMAVPADTGAVLLRAVLRPGASDLGPLTPPPSTSGAALPTTLPTSSPASRPAPR